jgi:hypothetical protein
MTSALVTGGSSGVVAARAADGRVRRDQGVRVAFSEAVAEETRRFLPAASSGAPCAGREVTERGGQRDRSTGSSAVT